MITDIDGVCVGHHTDADAHTGCTVVVLPPGTKASGEVRGGAPATREFSLLAPTAMVDEVDAVVLTGGSAFGLAAADGVMAHLEAVGRGYGTKIMPVPIVVGMAIFDLGVGDHNVRPTAADGFAAAQSATPDAPQTGRIGAGTGATTGKWRGPEHAVAGGLGSAVKRDGDLIVAALMVVNATGDLDTAGTADQAVRFDAGSGPTGAGELGANTTIGLIVTNAKLDKVGCHLVAQSGHDGLARALWPAHTLGDGDAIVAAATGEVEAPVDRVRMLAAAAVAEAIRSAPQGDEPT